MIYLDYQATTPLAPEARAAMMSWLSEPEENCSFANPSSAHRAGRAAAAVIEYARDQVAALLPAGGRVYFTSGATEALNWALTSGASLQNGGIATLAIEHPAVLQTAARLGAVTEIAVDSKGITRAVTENTLPTNGIVAAMLVNNEVGTIQPIAELARMAHRRGSWLICDAVQGYGRVAIPGSINSTDSTSDSTPDMIALSAHKIHGPMGIGALWVRDGISLAPLIVGGAQEGGMRAGTTSPALCVGFGTAAALAAEHWHSDHAHCEQLWQIAQQAIADWECDWTLNGSAHVRYRGNINIRLAGVNAARLLSDARGVAFSLGSACGSGSGQVSHVLRAMGLTESAARESIRLGWGRYTTAENLREGLSSLKLHTERQRVA